MKVDLSRVKGYCHLVFEDYYPLDPFDADERRRNLHNYMAACLACETVKSMEEARGLLKSAFRIVEDKWFGDKNYRNLDKISAYFKKLLNQIDDDLSSGMSPEQVISKMKHEEGANEGSLIRRAVKAPCKCKVCGHEAIVRGDDIGWFVRCINDFCSNRTEYFYTPNEAVDSWNEGHGK